MVHSGTCRFAIREGTLFALNVRISLAGLGAVLWLLLDNTAARAFSQPSYYVRDAALGGGGGRWFTGTTVDGYTCAVCHTGENARWPLHIEGLPAVGYVPGARYDVRITWPEFSARADALRAEMPMPMHAGSGPELAGPDLGVLAEFSTSTGAAAGQLEMDYENVQAPERRDEWCLHLDGVPASQLFDTHADEADQPQLACAPNAPDQRCVLAVQVCGARTLRFRWTAPTQDVGPVWFNAGLVATEALNADSSSDSVTFVRQPLYAAGSEGQGYIQTIDHGCSVRGVRGASDLSATVLLAWTACAFVCLRSSSKRSGKTRREKT